MIPTLGVVGGAGKYRAFHGLILDLQIPLFLLSAKIMMVINGNDGDKNGEGDDSNDERIVRSIKIIIMMMRNIFDDNENINIIFLYITGLIIPLFHSSLFFLVHHIFLYKIPYHCRENTCISITFCSSLSI